MKTDKELLKLAAKAAGYKDIKHGASGFYRVIGEHEDGTLCMTQFNPLTDDGDALRLAVKLGLYIFIDVDKVSTDAPTVTTVEPFNEDPLAATRRAIVRAAAAIGEVMKQRLRDLEARELWIKARVDELMDDDEWISNIRGCWIIADTCKTLSVYTHEAANSQAAREHASIIADLEEALTDSGVRE